jgi:glycosyltransferase involved in cell wall biosynthesis
MMSATLPKKESPTCTPLLSICVPTHNRAHLLRITLQAALPQVKQCGELVELCVCDNASSDNTAEVVESSREFGPVRYARNSTNLGFVGNIVRLATDLAQGEYIWLVGDDDVLVPDAVARVLNTLQANSEIDAFYANFRLAWFEKDWPESAVGGHAGSFFGLNCPEMEDRRLAAWKEIIRAGNGLCGNMYGNIVRRHIWVDYWRGRKLPRSSSHSLLAVYPHTCMFADTLMNRPAYYIGQPVLTIFEGSQDFIREYDKVFACFLPRVLRYYHRRGLSSQQLRDCETSLFAACKAPLIRMLEDTSLSPTIVVFSFLRGGWRYATAWRTLSQAVRGTGRPWLLKVMFAALSKLKRCFQVTSFRRKGT